MELTGWHGTTNRCKEHILKSGFSYKKYQPGKVRQKHPNDLGNGCYFFLPFNRDSGKLIASAYVSKYRSFAFREKNVCPELLEVKMEFISEEYIFDLDKQNNQNLLKEFRVTVKSEIDRELSIMKEDGAKKRASHLNENQGLVIELLLDLRANVKKPFVYQAVRATTYTDVPQMPKLNGFNGKEICVKDLNCIKEIK